MTTSELNKKYEKFSQDYPYVYNYIIDFKLFDSNALRKYFDYK